MKKRIISLLLCLCMVFSLLPTAVLAADGEDPDTPAGSGQVTQQDSEKSDDTEGQDTPTDPEQEEPVQGPTAEEQLAEMIENLPDPSEIDPLDEMQVEAIHNQISAIYDFAKANDLGDRENGLLDKAANATVNTVIAAAWPAETLEIPATEGGMSGTSGGVDWRYENGVLTISAANTPENNYTSGMMKDYDSPTSTNEDATIAPWYNSYSTTITEVQINEGVTSIGDNAFGNLTSLEKANIPANITDLGDHIFRGDTNLTAVEWADGFQAPAITDTDSNSGTYAGPFVPTSMFDGCTSLGDGQELSKWLPDSFIGVGCAAFRGTKFTVNFDAWRKLKYIGAYAFSEMPNLGSFRLTDKIIIGLRGPQGGASNAFTKSGLKSLTVDVETVPKYFAYDANKLAKIVLTDKVTNITTGAFSGTAITELVIPSRVKKLGNWSFLNCSSLKKLTLLGEITLEGVQFPGTPLEELVIGKDAVVTCTDDPFRATGDYPAMTSLEKASILGTFTSSSADKDAKTFWRCFSSNTNLTEVVLSGENAINFSQSAFPNVTTLSILGGDATFLGYTLGDSELEKVTIAVGNYSSQSGSFRYAKNLKTFRLKADSANLDNRAFVECPSLVAVDLTECSSITYGDNTFGSMTTTGETNDPTPPTAIIYVSETSADPKEADNKAGLSNSHGIVAITNGGTFAEDTEFTSGTLATPTKKDYTFGGWYASTDFSGDAVTTPEAGKTYYAKWEKNNTPEPTNADFVNGLVTVKCLNPVAHNDVQYGLTAAAKKYTKTQLSATEYSVTYDADAFAVNGHSLYSTDKLNWTLTYDGSKWNLAPNTDVDDVVLVTHAPTTFDEVTKFIDGRTDVIHTSCVNGETATCAYGLMVAFMNPDHVVSVEQEKDSSSGEPIRGSYIATLKMDQFAEACAKACNGKSFTDSPRTHDVRSQNPVKWRFQVRQADVSTDTGAEKQYVWSAEPVTPGTDDVCQVAHRVVLTFSYNQHDVMVDDTKVEYKYNTTEITNNVEVPAPTREGYTFVQWLDADGNAFDPTATVTEDHTYNNIEWKPIKYRVIFDANAGGKNVTGTMEDQVFTYDQPQSLNANQFVCTDSVFDDRLKQDTQLYVFGGWNTEADGSGDTYADEADFTNKSVTHGERITLYAQWKHVTKTLTYVSEHGTAPSAADVDIFTEVTVAGAPANVEG